MKITKTTNKPRKYIKLREFLVAAYDEKVSQHDLNLILDTIETGFALDARDKAFAQNFQDQPEINADVDSDAYRSGYAAGYATGYKDSFDSNNSLSTVTDAFVAGVNTGASLVDVPSSKDFPSTFQPETD